MNPKPSLSEQQSKIKKGRGCFVVKACPGSGKTFSVAARIAHLLNNPEYDFHFKGIAAISFTNVACDEIQEKLKNEFDIPTPLKFPHFIGTLDSFINKFIFLPYGHLFMKCKARPVHVGHPYSFWDDYDISKRKRYKDNETKKWKISSRDPNEYFDKVSFDKNDEPISQFYAEFFPFSWGNIRKKDGDFKKPIKDIIDAKWFHFNKGKATQADANYIAYKVLCAYQDITQNIVNRFSHFIIDEAQDTTDVQMGIINKLNEQGAKDMVLIGDPDQAIFEWNDAKPEQFNDMYKKWEQSREYDLLENRRSSKLICACTRKLLPVPEYQVINEQVKDYDFKPEIIGHNNDKDSLEKTLNDFKQLCNDRGIPIKDKNGNHRIAVLYRTHALGEFLGVPKQEKENTPWKIGHYAARDIAQGKYLIEKGEFKRGFKLIEKGYHKIKFELSQLPSNHIKNKISEIGFKAYRNNIFSFVDFLPSTSNINLKDWVVKINEKLEQYHKKIVITSDNSKVSFDELFKNTKEVIHPDYFLGTIHSAKGKTFEAVLVVLNDRMPQKRAFNKILKDDYSNLKPSEKEELRTVYVAITRPRRILKIAVPNEDIEIWNEKLGLNLKSQSTQE